MSGKLPFGGLRRGRPELDADIDAELQSHLQMRADDLIENGWQPAAAEEEARRRFGDRQEIRRRCLDHTANRERRLALSLWLAELGGDIKLGWRFLRRRPGFALGAILTLALGIGANTALFSALDAVLLRQLPYSQPDRLVALWTGIHSGAEFEAIAALPGLESAAAWAEVDDQTLNQVGEPSSLKVARVTPGLFEVLGTFPAVGRGFVAEEGRPDAPKTVILSHRTWRERLHSDPAAIGRSVRLDGASHTVVGIMAPSFAFPSAEVEIWLPVQLDPLVAGSHWGSSYLQLLGRLAPGATAGGVAQEIRHRAARLRLENPVWTPAEGYGQDVSVLPLQVEMSRNLRQLLWILFASVAGVLVVACVNVANLLLARSASRRREVAIRSSLGASRQRLLRQLLTESLLLAGAGALAGLLLAKVLLELILRGLPQIDGRFGTIGFDGRVAIFTLSITLLTTLMFGLAPAWRTASSNLQSSLKRGSVGHRRGRSTAGALVIAQVGLAVILVTGAGLLLRSFWQAIHTDPGFSTERVVTLQLDPADGDYAESTRQVQLYDHLLDRLRALPGVQSAAAVDFLPTNGSNRRMAFRVESRDFPPGNLPMAIVRTITPDYLQTLGIPLLEGRDFDSRDRPNALQTVLVNESLARFIWGDQDATGVVGEQIGYPWESPWLEVVGVVGDVRQRGVDQPAEMAIYFPFPQRPTPSMALVARTSGPPSLLAGSLREALDEIDPGIPATQLRTLHELLWGSLSDRLFSASLLGGLALVTLLLGTLGIYSVMSYGVAQRRNEIGLRMALGARPSEVLSLVLREAMVLTAIGIVIGLAGAAWLTRFLGPLLFRTGAREPAVFAAVAVVLATVALSAALWPARRAARVDPLTSLRGEG